MITEVPFSYSANIIPPRKRNPQSTPVKALCPVSIREMDDSYFALVARFSDNDTDVRFPGTLHEIRTDGRNFYMPFYDPNSILGRPKVNFRSDQLVPNLEGHLASSPFRSIQNICSWNRPGDSSAYVLERQIEGKVLSHNRAERTALIGAAAAGTVSYDGIIWCRSGEPCFEINRNRTASVVMRDHEAVALGAEKLWRADKFDECVDLVNGGEPFDHVYGRIEVIMPEAFRTKIGTMAMYNIAIKAIENAAPYLRKSSRESLMRYADLRDSLNDTQGEITPELEKAVQDVVDAPSSVREGYPVAEMKIAKTRWKLETAECEPEPHIFRSTC